MTPLEEADRAQRRWIVIRLLGSAGFIVLGILGFVLLFAVKAQIAGLVVLGFAIVFRISVPLLAIALGNRVPGAGVALGRPAGTWWYNHRTGEVEEGPQSLGLDRDGPYATREDAMRAPEIARERAAKWNAED